MEPRISIVTLGVDDLDRAVRFYEAMGLERNRRVTDGVAFFQMGGTILALWFRKELARDAGLDGLPPSNVGTARPASALAYSTRSDEEGNLRARIEDHRHLAQFRLGRRQRRRWRADAAAQRRRKQEQLHRHQPDWADRRQKQSQRIRRAGEGNFWRSCSSGRAA